MPMWDYDCQKCGKVTELYFTRFVDHPNCLDCGEPMDYRPAFNYTSETRAQRFSPVVIHKDAAGNVRFPGRADAPVPEGFQKVELTNIHEVRKFEKDMNSRDREQAEKFRGVRGQFLDGQLAANREAMKELVKRFTPRGRFFYDKMREASEAKQKQGAKDVRPAFYIDAFSNDASNRESHFDERNQHGRSMRGK